MTSNLSHTSKVHGNPSITDYAASSNSDKSLPASLSASSSSSLGGAEAQQRGNGGVPMDLNVDGSKRETDTRWWIGLGISATVAAVTVTTATWMGWKYRKRIGQYLYTLWYGSEERLHKQYICQSLDIVDRNIDAIEEEFSQVYNQLESLLKEASENASEENALEYKRKIQALLLTLNEGKNEAESVLANLDQLVIRRLSDGQEIENVEEEKQRKKKLSERIDTLTAMWESLCIQARQKNAVLQRMDDIYS
eukprot:gb/GECG01016126.1/.p1 GENE.gb/GECG01016126.1/~~gb/GECG01016126.1/.p1  ORF type:complete len:251 (+),score=49.84 gb/GECG01016126.1/:1-753(+)